jgi:hypothetical protein
MMFSLFTHFYSKLMAILTTPLDPCPYSEYLTDPNTDPALSKNLIFFLIRFRNLVIGIISTSTKRWQ